MKILVTGSNGFIGKYLVGKLIAGGHEVCGFDNQCNQAEDSKIKCIIGDIRNKDALMEALDAVDVVIHLVAAHRDFGILESEYFDVNVNGTKNLLSGCSKLGIDKFIFCSSVAVYGLQPKPTDENTIPNPITPYGQSKIAAEKVIEQWVNASSKRQVIIIRPTVIFGPENYANVYNLIDKICRRKFIFIGNGSNVKSVAYVENLVEVIMFSLKRLKPGIEVYNYSDEPQMTIRQIVETIATHAGVTIPGISISLPVATIGGSIFDFLGKITGYDFPFTAARMKKFCDETYHRADKIRKDGFVAPISLEEGFRRTVKWYLEQQLKSKQKKIH